MKNINKKHTLLSLCLILFIGFTACSEDEIVEQTYLDVSALTHTFDSHGGEFTLEIETQPGWTYTFHEGREWISLQDSGEDFITLVAAPNNSGVERSTAIDITNGPLKETVSLNQLTIGDNPVYYLLEEAITSGVSLNGKYVAHVDIVLEEGQRFYVLYRRNTETGIDEALIKSLGSFKVQIVSNGGTVFLLGANDVGSQFITEKNKVENLNVPDGYNIPVVTGCSSDESIMVGWVYSVSNRNSVPCKWVNGVCELLEVPKTTIDGADWKYGAEAMGCSEDGSVIAGVLANNFTLIYWKDGQVHFAGKDVLNESTITTTNIWGQEEDVKFIERLENRFRYYGISHNGRYLSAAYRVSENKKAKSYPAVFDIETQTTTFIKKLPDNPIRGGSAIAAFDNGSFSFANYVGVDMGGGLIIDLPLYGFVYAIDEGMAYSVSDYLKKNVGIILVDPTAKLMKFSTDKSIIYGENSAQDPVGNMYTKGWYIK